MHAWLFWLKDSGLDRVRRCSKLHFLPRHTPPKFRLTANRGKRRKRKKNKNTASALASVRVPIVPAGGGNAVKDSRRTSAALARKQRRHHDRVAAWQAEEPDQSDRAAAAADSVSKARSASRVQLPQTAKASWLPPLPPPPGRPPPVFGLPLGPLPPPGPRLLVHSFQVSFFSAHPLRLARAALPVNSCSAIPCKLALSCLLLSVQLFTPPRFV